MLTCQNLACERGGRLLFRDLGFSLREEGILLLSGANGSGKTSLLKIIAGLLEPDAGEVLYSSPLEGELLRLSDSESRSVGGKSFKNTPHDSASAFQASAPSAPPQGGSYQRIRSPADYGGDALYIGHKNAVKPEETVAENVRFWAKLYDSEIVIPAALHYWGLEPYLDFPCGQLSAGWQRRVALTRLLTCPAPLWLLDEPTSNLDEEGVQLLWGLVQSRTQKDGMVVMATHFLPAKQGNIEVLKMENFS